MGSQVDGMMNSILARSAVRSAARPTFAVARRYKSAAAAEAGGLDTVLKADHSTTALHLYHKTNLLAIGLTPLAFVVPESVPVLPCVLNVFLGVVFPIHGHIGMAGVLTDYVPKIAGKGALNPARYALMGLTTVTVLGLLKHNLTGDGMTKSV